MAEEEMRRKEMLILVSLSLSLPLCLSTGTEVDWVQCDGCNKWFHMVCVGLSKGDLKPDEDFVCKSCARKKEGGNEGATGGVGLRSSVGGGGGAATSSQQPTAKVKRTANRSL